MRAAYRERVRHLQALRELHEPITPRTLVASALIIGAVVAMVSGRRRDERVPAVDRDRLERGEGVDRAAAD